MRTKRDYNLIVNGNYNRKAIMQRAYAYMCRYSSCKWYTFRMALKESWVDAHLKMDEYKARIKPVADTTDDTAPVRNLRAFLYRPGYENYDSSWR